jgi:hypothetical protein
MHYPNGYSYRAGADTSLETPGNKSKEDNSLLLRSTGCVITGSIHGQGMSVRDLDPQASHFHSADTDDSSVVSSLRGPQNLKIEFTAGYPSVRQPLRLDVLY